MTTHNTPSLRLVDLGYQEVDVFDEPSANAVWVYMKAAPRPCFTLTLLRELISMLNYLSTRAEGPPRFLVHGSAVPGLYNLGGDLALFRQKILEQDLDGLKDYGYKCVECVYQDYVHPGLPGLTTIAMVQGDALGGGFEAALSANILVAEEGTRLGFPEILFNLFPGMGAMSFLGRRVGYAEATRMILSGRIFSSEELFARGVIDILAPAGKAEETVRETMRRVSRALNGTLAARRAREISQPLAKAELLEIVDVWAEAALRLTQKDLTMMERLVSRQNVKFGA